MNRSTDNSRRIDDVDDVSLDEAAAQKRQRTDPNVDANRPCLRVTPDVSSNTNGPFTDMCREESLRVMHLIRLQQQRRTLGMPVTRDRYAQPHPSLQGPSAYRNAQTWSPSSAWQPPPVALSRPTFPNEHFPSPPSPAAHLEAYLQSQAVKRMMVQQRLSQQQRLHLQHAQQDAMIQNVCRPDFYRSPPRSSSFRPFHGHGVEYTQGDVHHAMTTGRAMRQGLLPAPVESPSTPGVVDWPAPMSRPLDSYVLSPLQVFLREHIEVFEATHDDVELPTRGRNKRIHLHQVGMRCRHCAHLPPMQRQKGSVYFPATLLGLYQAAQNMNSNHLQCGLCVVMPDDMKQQFVTLLCGKGKTSSGAGRAYWAESAKQMGVVDTTLGMFRTDRVPEGVTLLDDTRGVSRGPVVSKSKSKIAHAV